MHWLRRLLVLAALLLGLAGAAPAAEFTVAKDALYEVGPPATPEDWDSVQGLFLHVHGRPEDRATLVRLARHGSRSLPRLASELGLPLGSTVHVALATSQQQFGTLQPGAPPHWADGTAWPVHGWIYLRHPRLRSPRATPLETVLDHELIHVLMGRAFAPNRPPRWLDEGAAQVWAGEFTPNTTRQLAKGLLGRDLYSLEELSWGFPRESGGARLAYAQSADLVSFIRAEYGDASFQTLLRELASGAEIHGAVRTATGQYLEDVDYAWRSRLSRPYLTLSALGAEDAMWFFTGVLGFFGVLVVHVRQRRRRARLLEEERLEDQLIAAMRQQDAMRWRPDLDGYRRDH